MLQLRTAHSSANVGQRAVSALPDRLEELTIRSVMNG